MKNTRELLLEHIRKYPNMEIRDIFKLLYQSAFGCEHLVSSFESATDYIRFEHKAPRERDGDLTVSLGKGYGRVHLSWLDRGLKPETLAKLFILSSKKDKSTKDELEETLKAAGDMIKDKTLPLSLDDFLEQWEKWRDEGYPAIRHSEQYRASYTPAYRVIANEYIPFIPLFAEIDKAEKKPFTVAIEGGSASGKSTLADLLSKVYDCTVFHMDDFFLRPEQRTKERYEEVGGNVDRERFLSEVLIPLSRNETVSYKRFDCSTFTLLPAETVIPKDLVIVEGAYSMHPALSGSYGLCVFLDISPALQKERISKRNTADLAERFYNEWIPMENIYFEKMQIKERCDLVIQINE